MFSTYYVYEQQKESEASVFQMHQLIATHSTLAATLCNVLQARHINFETSFYEEMALSSFIICFILH
jgi:hypothetical protein